MHATRNSDDSLSNEDLAAIPTDKRTWSCWNYASLWISMAACIPTYMLASSLIEKGMNWWQAVLTIFLGNLVVLIPMVLYSFIGVAVTSATAVIFGKTIWDPVDVLTRFKNPLVLVIAMFALCIATLATNIAANVVSPANDFANLAPQKISFRTGGFITGIIGVLLMPWKLVADPSGYIFTWLVGLGLAFVIYLLFRKISPVPIQR